ncbi:hypothetical protein [Mariniradius sediminis]|uniref:PepSY domain-containing protein n=1 Tax=Mariniradius sediminis TaxID=2909237 RepID=A0ABS9BS68_9BACT|nr:hypothetical protein [Mariniradius sediminis]MCF1750327.1 hypothetical protein [Mariniradius sediminis]
MKRLLNIVFLFFISTQLYSQTYLTSEVIEKAESHLKQAVGEELFNYFKLDPDSYYEYKNRTGKTKWENINKGKKTKGDFVNGKNIRFILNHPEFQYQYVDKRISVQLASDLSLNSEINLDRIPKYLLEGRKSDWLNENQLDKIIGNQGLKKSVKNPIKRLEFDFDERKYYWMVFNTLYEEKCYSDEELLHIDPKTGQILKHYEERHYVMHCH